jgi:hypothetical protein
MVKDHVRTIEQPAIITEYSTVKYFCLLPDHKCYKPFRKRADRICYIEAEIAFHEGTSKDGKL